MSNSNTIDAYFDSKTREMSPVENGEVACGLDVKDGSSTKDTQDHLATAKNTTIQANTEEKVAENVEWVLNYESPLDTVVEMGERLLKADNPEYIVRDWELTNHLHSANGKPLTKKARKIAMLTASINLYENRGITVKDVRRLGFGKDYAEKILQEGRKAGLLTPSELKIGKQKQYFMSNYKYVIDKRARESKRQEIFPNDISLLLARELSNMNYVYHDIGLQTMLLHSKDYELIGDRILSEKNMQKVLSFRIERQRTSSITISANGTVSVYIGCTTKPYEWHTPSGLVDFFASCGQIFGHLQASIKNRLQVVPPVAEWCLTQFDYNKDLVVEELRDKNPLVIWAARGLLKVKYLGAVFQVYSKDMPGLGECLRVEGHYSTRQKENVVETVENIAGSVKLPFTTAEDMLLSAGRKNGDDEKK